MPTPNEIIEERRADFYQFLAECIKVAEHRGTISYEAIGKVINQPAINTRYWAAAISKEAVRGGHPMLSAVIVGKNNGIPGEGFYTLAHEMEKLSQDPDTMSEEAKIEFWKSELNEVYKTFSK